MLISLVQWAQAAGHTDAAARKLIARGKLPEAHKIGRNWLIDDAIPWPNDRRYNDSPA